MNRRIEVIHGFQFERLKSLTIANKTYFRIAQVEMSAMNFFNKIAEICRYKPFKELKPGKYVINEFFIKNDKQTGSGNLLCAKIACGKRYVILPKQFVDQTNGVITLDHMNAEPCVLVFIGSRSQFDVEIRFEPFVEGVIYEFVE